ncbi:MAG TPA: mercuric reductase [Gemmatimonadales bacterium]|nr:mercuric reductase [Gemmatimonadales bacterium]
MTTPGFPVDAADEALLAQVRPRDWVNPSPAPRYHLVVVGAGTGGLVTAAIAAGLGARVALVERHLMGGDCLNVGCVPSKALLAAARAWHDARHATAYGGPAGQGEGDFAAVMRRLRALRAQLAPADAAARFQRELGVDVFLGTGRFMGPGTLAVTSELDAGGETRLRFRRAVIATGARAALPPIPGLAAAGARTNETIFDLTVLPRRLVVLGAGPIGCELAQAFARFGSAVTVLERGPRVLPRDDADAAALVQAALERDGVRFRFGASVEAVEREAAGDGAPGGARVVRGRDVRGVFALACDELLVATGRAANVEGLGLDAAGIAHTTAGVTVDDRLRTTNRRVYAVGDVASRWRFTHAADAMARLVVANALFFGRGRASRLVVPWCTYTSPEVAHVGLTAEAAAAAGVAIDTITVPFEHLDRAVLEAPGGRAEAAAEGFCRVHLARRRDRIVGATLVGAHAGETIAEVTLAMTRGLGLGALGATIHPYPTRAEALRKAADAWRRTRLTPTARRVLDLFWRLFR